MLNTFSPTQTLMSSRNPHLPVSEDSASRALDLVGWLLIASAAFAYRLSIPVVVFNSCSLFDLALIIAVISLIVIRIVGSDTPLSVGDRRTFIILALPVLLSLLSLIWSQDIRSTVRSLLSYVEAIAAFVLGVNIFAHLSPRAIVTRMGCIVLGILAGSLFSYLRVPGFLPTPPGMDDNSVEAVAYLICYQMRLSHPFLGLSNNLASVLSFFTVVFLGYGTAYKNNKVLVMFWISLTAIILTFSRGCILSVSICLLCFILLGGSTKLMPKIIALILFGAIAFSYFPNARLSESEYSVQEVIENRFDPATLSARIDLIEVAIEKIAKAPFLGYGDGVAPDYEWEFTAHNTYLQQILYFGVPLGLLLSLALLFLPWQYLRAEALDYPEALMSRGLGLAIVSQLLIFLTETSFESSLLKVLLYFSLGMGVTLVNNVRYEHSSPTE